MSSSKKKEKLKRIAMVIRLEPDIHWKLREICFSKRLSVQKMLEKIIVKLIEKEERNG